MSKSQNPAIYIDAARSRVRIFRSTIKQLGNPAYIQLLVNPTTLCIAVLPSDSPNKSLTHRVKQNTVSYEINSKLFVNKLLELYSPISHFNKLKIEGQYSETQNTAFFSLLSAVCVSDNRIWMMNDLSVDPEFQKLIAPLSDNEKALLRESLLNEGCREPICIWDNIIIDGHNRYEICTANNIPYTTKSFLFKSRNDVIIWICANQLGRKNITEETRKYLIGKRYEAEKNIRSKNIEGRNQYSDIVIDEQNAAASTANKLGNEYHLSHNTVLKYGYYAKALDKLSKVSPILASRILSGNIKVSQENAVKLSQLPDEDLTQLSERLSKQRNVCIKYSDSRKSFAGKSITPVPISVMPIISVKDMPEYDPDAEISSLKLTIPSWISSIKRVQSVTNKSEISESAKKQLSSVLQQLNDCTLDMLSFLEEDNISERNL